MYDCGGATQMTDHLMNCLLLVVVGEEDLFSVTGPENLPEV